MVYSKRMILLLLCSILLFAAAGCENASDANPSETTVTSTVTKAVTETEAITETAATTVLPEPDPEPQYEWLIEPGIYTGDMQKVQSIPTIKVNIGVVILDNKHLVDYSGNIKYTLSDTDKSRIGIGSLCDACEIIDSTDGPIEPNTYENVSHLGHGGYFFANYIYDSETGFICFRDYGGYAEVTENIPFAIVSEGVRRPAVPEDNVGNDYAYDLTGRYGIVVNSELVVPFEYEAAARYDTYDIAKLKKDGKWAFFNSEGKALTGNDYLDFRTITDNIIAVNRDGKWGYINLEGNVIVDHVFEDALPIYCGMAWVKTSDGWGVIKIYEQELMTEEEAKQIILDRFDNDTNIESIDIVPNDVGYYECIGYGFDVKITYTSGRESVSSHFVNYDGTEFTPNYYTEQ